MLTYVMSTYDEYHRIMIEQSPTEEPNSFLHPDTGKFEKVFSTEELDELYNSFTLVKARRVEKIAKFNGKGYHCKHHWRIYQQPNSS